MAKYKLMQLIPFDPNFNTLINPIETNKIERETILKNDKSSKTEKLNMLTKNISDYNTLSHEKSKTNKNNLHNINFNFLSPRLKTYAQNFLNELVKQEKFMLDKNEIILNNTKLVGSNIIDLIVDLITHKRVSQVEQPPQFLQQFLNFLIDIHFPLSFIKNKLRIQFINQLKSYKSSVDPPIRASSRKRKINVSPNKFKRFQKKSESAKKRIVWP